MQYITYRTGFFYKNNFNNSINIHISEKMPIKDIYYSDKYTDDKFEYRHVMLPKVSFINLERATNNLNVYKLNFSSLSPGLRLYAQLFFYIHV